MSSESSSIIEYTFGTIYIYIYILCVYIHIYLQHPVSQYYGVLNALGHLISNQKECD